MRDGFYRDERRLFPLGLVQKDGFDLCLLWLGDGIDQAPSVQGTDMVAEA